MEQANHPTEGLSFKGHVTRLIAKLINYNMYRSNAKLQSRCSSLEQCRLFPVDNGIISLYCVNNRAHVLCSNLYL